MGNQDLDFQGMVDILVLLKSMGIMYLERSGWTERTKSMFTKPNEYVSDKTRTA